MTEHITQYNTNCIGHFQLMLSAKFACTSKKFKFTGAVIKCLVTDIHSYSHHIKALIISMHTFIHFHILFIKTDLLLHSVHQCSVFTTCTFSHGCKSILHPIQGV